MAIPKLLLRVRSKVIPEVFNHPLWIDFVNSDRQPSPELIQHLRNSARKYETQGEMLSSSEILLLCASLQKQLKNFEAAINSLQRARHLAKNHELPQFAIFAAWGTAAQYYNQGDLQLTIQSLTRLQKLVEVENDWVLIDIIELIKQHLHNPDEDAGALSIALDWLKNWEKQTSAGKATSERSKIVPVGYKSSYVTRLIQRFFRIVGTILSLPVSLITKRDIDWEKLDADDVDLDTQKIKTVRGSEQPDLGATEQTQPERDPHYQVVQTRGNDAPTLIVYCLGQFRVYQDEELIAEWPSGIGKSIFKYLITHRDRPVSKDRLMDLFWKDSDPDSARNNLNVAIYGLRKALRAIRSDFSHVLFQDDHYHLNPRMSVWVDIEKFSHHFEIGRRHEMLGETAKAVDEYEIAAGLYSGDFLLEDSFEDWTMIIRRRLKESYLFTLDRLSRYYFDDKQYATCVHICQKILAEDDCREDAHRRLMRCYFHQSQPYLALRQYHLCKEILKNELDILPTSETTDLYEFMRRHNRG